MQPSGTARPRRSRRQLAARIVPFAGLLAWAAAANAGGERPAESLPAEPGPVDYVRACDAFGRGFLVVPGTDTCFEINGYVVAEWHVFGSDKASRQPGFYGKQDANVGYARFDQFWNSASNTEYGLLRTYVKLEIIDTPPGGFLGDLRWAYVEFGGLTFGRLQSRFDFFTGNTYEDVFEPAWSDTENMLAAYTATIGKGLTATLSIEDNVGRRVGIIGGGTGDGYGGARLPDIIAAIAADQDWGHAQLMAALHEVRSARRVAGSRLGWALAAGATLDVPFTGKGDQFTLQASIGQGALNYNATDPIGPGEGFGGADARVVGGTRLVLADVWAVGAEFDHNWTDQWASVLNGSWLEVDQAGNRYDFRNIDAQLNLSYAPVDDLTFTAEGEYKHIDRTKGSDGNAFVMMFILERDF
jgi:hypothetical protein